MLIGTTMSAMKLHVRRAVAAALIAAVLPFGAYAQMRRVSLPAMELPAPVRPIPENANLWQCSYTGNSIACQLVRKYDALAPGAAVAANQPVDARLPPLVDSIRNYPETLAGGTVVIPVLGIPIDLSFVAELADSVMCNSRVDCGVVFVK